MKSGLWNSPWWWVWHYWKLAHDLRLCRMLVTRPKVHTDGCEQASRPQYIKFWIHKARFSNARLIVITCILRQALSKARSCQSRRSCRVSVKNAAQLVLILLRFWFLIRGNFLATNNSKKRRKKATQTLCESSSYHRTKKETARFFDLLTPGGTSRGRLIIPAILTLEIF